MRHIHPVLAALNFLACGGSQNLAQPTAQVTAQPTAQSSTHSEQALELHSQPVQTALDALDQSTVRFNIPVNGSMPQKGSRDALVTIVAWSDFECPFCSHVEPTLTQLMDAYPGMIRVVWRNAPLPFHQDAKPAAEAAMEAFAQGGSAGFWAMHQKLMANQHALTLADLERYAQELGLDIKRFRNAMDAHTHLQIVEQDIAQGNKFGVSGTPAFFINGRSLVGAQPFDAFKTIVDEEIANATKLRQMGIAATHVYEAIVSRGLNTPHAADAEGAMEARPSFPHPDPTAVYNVPVGTSPVKGPQDALVTVVIVSDFQCPFCARVKPTLEQLETGYGRDIRFVFKHNPLPFHDHAMPAAQAAIEIYEQKGAPAFWRYHDILFANQTALTRSDLERYARRLGGVNMRRFNLALDQNKHEPTVIADQTLARSLGARGTPSFFINGRLLKGAQPLGEFKKIIDEELAKSKAKVAAGTPRAQIYEAIIANGATEPVMIAPE